MTHSAGEPLSAPGKVCARGGPNRFVTSRCDVTNEHLPRHCSRRTAMAYPEWKDSAATLIAIAFTFILSLVAAAFR